MTRDRAEMLAIEALEWIGNSTIRMNRFLEMTGLDPLQLRETAKLPGFFPGILDWIVADEATLRLFAMEAFTERARDGCQIGTRAGQYRSAGPSSSANCLQPAATAALSMRTTMARQPTARRKKAATAPELELTTATVEVPAPGPLATPASLPATVAPPTLDAEEAPAQRDDDRRSAGRPVTRSRLAGFPSLPPRRLYR
ncbi:DUF3572 family protein [Chelatococcus reniformis]|nr:DUF3572 family protein [Chelatococcus reniformis]